MATSTARVSSSVLKFARVVHAELDVEVVGAAGEQFDEARRGVLGEQAGRRDAQHPASRTGLADFQDGPVLQPEHLGGAAGQPQAARGERQAGRGRREQLVAELLAQLPDVQRDRCFADRRALLKLA